MKPLRFGLFGGTFAPVHLGHIHAAKEFLSYCDLDELHIIPTYLAPHKEMPTMLTPVERLELLRLAKEECLCDRRVVIDDFEIRQGGFSYTYQTLQHFSHPDRELWFLCGTDMFLTLDQWKEPKTIFSLAKIAFLYRSDADASMQGALEEKARLYRERYGAQIVQIPTNAIDISSSELRADLQSEKNSVYLPASVKKYLNERFAKEELV